MSLVHIPEASTWYCLIHHAIEPDRPGDYRVCGECFHVYRTEGDLVEACAEIGHPVGNGDESYACPLCTHDF